MSARIGILGGWVRGHGAELRLGLRVTVAGVLTFALARLFALPQGYWAVITAVIVMQASVGGSVKAALDRFAGTFAGAAYGAVVAAVVPHLSAVGLGIAVAVAIAPLAVLAAVKASFRVAPVTALIMLLTSTGQAIGPLASAFDRIVEIGLGNVIGVAVALFVLPARAHGIMTEAAARVLDLFADLFPTLLNGLAVESDQAAIQSLQRSVRGALKKVESAADEASRERRTHLTDEPDPEPLVRTLYRVRHDLVMVGRATAVPMPSAIHERLRPALGHIAETAEALFRDLGRALKTRAAPPRLEAFEAARTEYIAAMDRVRSDHLTQDLPGEAVGRIFAFRFALEQLSQDLGDLIDRAAELARAEAVP